ncbi:MAG: glycosyltransferase [Candidatus Pacearchaeota archaeon]
MYTFAIQLIDLIKLRYIQLFAVFFVLSWAIYLTKLIYSSKYWGIKFKDYDFKGKVSVLIPVVDEDEEVWKKVLESIKNGLKNVKHEVIVIANGKNGEENIKLALKYGFKVIRLSEASKRKAIEAGVEKATGEITIILDSDTIVLEDSIKKLLKPFRNPQVGGTTPRHIIFNRKRSLYTRISDWLEDIRFNEVVAGQSIHGAVSCLPGRLLAVRTNLLKRLVPELVNQKFLGARCISGDDRFLTSWLLERGYYTAYVPESVVMTNAPETLEAFVKQRLRWSRTSLRETIRSLGWIWNYPFTAFTTISNVVLRWLFFAVIILALFKWVGIINIPHYVNFTWYFVSFGTIAGFFISGFLRQFRHIYRYPEDLLYLPLFLIVTTFILTPVEWLGNITLKESKWMTRNTK